jgi:hypothetical protein
MEQLGVRQARAQYFEDNGFGDDGGYGAAWVDFSLGPIPFPFPNTPMRVRAVRYHDLHHLVTGYGTDFEGELEIAAWELGAGCRDFIVPWQLNLGGLGVGVWWMTRRLFAAFVRGRRSQSLYGAPFEPLLEMTVGELRAGCLGPHDSASRDLDAQAPRARPSDYLWFALATLVGMFAVFASLLPGLVTLPFGLAAMAWRRRAVA